ARGSRARLPSPAAPDVVALRGPDECVHRVSTLNERSPFAAVSSRRQTGWVHDPPTSNRTRAKLAARNYQACHDEIRNGEMAEQTKWQPDNCALRCLPPGSSRSRADRHPPGAGWPGARCFGRGPTGKGIEDK